MKKLILIPLLAMFASCAVLENSFSLDKAPQLINKVVPSAVTIGVKKQPKSEPYLRALVTQQSTTTLLPTLVACVWVMLAASKKAA